MQDRILIIDFGSQYTQLIARRVRELNVYSEIHPWDKCPEITKDIKGVILSGSTLSIQDKSLPSIDLNAIKGKIPLLGISYGAEYILNNIGGAVSSGSSIYTKKNIGVFDASSDLLKGISANSQVWIPNEEEIKNLPSEGKTIASTEDGKGIVFSIEGEQTYGVLFHPEVYHSTEGGKVISNFVVEIAKCEQSWTPEAFVADKVKSLKEQIGDEKVILGLSGGVDSSVAATILHKAIGSNLHCIFVNNGLLRKNEYEEVLESYKGMGLNVKGVDASQKFYQALKGLTDPELKRKAIGKVFVDVFDEESKLVENAKWLGQGTIYPDVIESISINGGKSQTIKSHHNVGGLPDYMMLEVVEPLRLLFKDEVRRVGKSLNIPANILGRHPFPGPGLGIRILGEVTPDKVKILQEVDAIFINELKEQGLYDDVWQAGAIFLPVNTVGVSGDKRTYEHAVALRAVQSVDGMTADWCHLPYEFLGTVSNKIINQVEGINRVTYDISSKPPATIEWE